MSCCSLPASLVPLQNELVCLKMNYEPMRKPKDARLLCNKNCLRSLKMIKARNLRCKKVNIRWKDYKNEITYQFQVTGFYEDLQ